MIHYKTNENILESDAKVLVNPVNCVGVMGKGLALQFKGKSLTTLRIIRKGVRAVGLS